MKMFSYVFVLLLLIFAGSCSKKQYPQESVYCTATPGGDTARIPFGQTVRLFTGCIDRPSAKVTLINDSRCPQGVQCIWAGILKIDLKLGELRLSLEKDKVVDTVYRGYRYSINLLDALPRPTKDQPKAEQTVLVSIARK